MKYYVYNHHDFWQWEESNSPLMDSEVVFIWNDWAFKKEVRALQNMGKKVIVYEHGFGALWDYELNARENLADGYLALGTESRESLLRVGVSPHKILVTGNPVYDDVKKVKRGRKEALFVALHWVRDVSIYNQTVYEQLKVAYPNLHFTAKLTEKTGNMISGSKWVSNTDNILQEIKDRLPEYDYVFTPRPSTFESMARLMGIPVYVVDEEQTYKAPGEPERPDMPNTYIKIGEPLPKMKRLNMDNYIERPSLDLIDISIWASQL